MIGAHLRWFSVLLLAIVLAPAASAGESRYKTKNVIIATMDGVRYADTFGEPHRQYIPQMAKLAQEATLFSKIFNTGVTITRQGHSTIATGTWQTVSLGGARQTMPTLWEYARNELGLPQKDCWVIFGKGNYSYAPYSSFPTYGRRYAPTFVINIGENALGDDDKVLAEVLKAIDSARPRTMFLNFGVTDHVGHSNNWENYLEAVRQCDRALGRLWEKVQSTPGYRDATTFFFTTDHGRHDDRPHEIHGGFASHGDHCGGCQHIWLLVAGPDTKKGAVIDRRALQIDIMPTAAELLGVQTPLAEGEVLADCFVNCRHLNKKLAKTPEARQALKLKKLAARDLVKTIADAMFQAKVELKPSPDTEILLRGMLRAAEVNKEKAYRRFVASWAKAHLAAGEQDGHVARILVELAASGGPAEYLALARKCAEQSAEQQAPSCPLACALRAGLLARVAQVAGEPKLAEAAKRALGVEGKTEAQLLQEWRRLQVKLPPMACLDPSGAAAGPAATLADSLRFLALADLAGALPKDRAARLACDLQQSACTRGVPELGGLWPSPTVSALNLYQALAIRPLRRIQPISQWATAPAPAAAKSPVKPPVKPVKPKGMPAPPAWAAPEKFYFDSFPYAVDLLRYQVDDKGHFGDGSVMADGAALLLFATVKSAPAELPAGGKPLPAVSPGCTRVIIEFGGKGNRAIRWKGRIAVENGELVAMLPYLCEPDDKVDADSRTFDCHAGPATDGLALDIRGSGATIVKMTCQPQGMTFTLEELRKKTIQIAVPGGYFLRAMVGS